MRSISLVVLLLAATTSDALSDSLVRHVPAEYSTIQAALDASSSGDVVLVAAGTYPENLVMSAQHDGVSLISEGGPEVTTIDGGQLGRVVLCTQLGPETRIEGFTLANGLAEPFTTDNIGGGLYLYDADLTIENNIIRDNFAEAAGGLYIDYSSPALVANIIRDNDALGSGGGIYCDHLGTARIERNVIARNSCGHYGGGVTIWVSATPELINNTIVSNTAEFQGGGVHITRNSHPTLSRNIIAKNSQGGGISRGDAESSASMTCNDIWENTPANYTGLPDVTGVDGNISSDPFFCNFENLDLRLAENSPCAPAHSPAGCDLIGALGVGCGPVAVEPATWGRIKARFAEDLRSAPRVKTPR